MTTKPRPFSMIRDFALADWFTLGNAASGVGALFSTMTYLQEGGVWHLYMASGLVLLALVFDILDGRIARWRQRASLLGRELDSLADVISFGVAPAVIGYGCGMQGGLDRAILLMFVCCGVSRLARYNVTAESHSNDEGKVTYFEGTPIPTSIVLVAVLCAAASMGALHENLWFGSFRIASLGFHPLSLMFAASGALMVSRLRIPKL